MCIHTCTLTYTYKWSSGQAYQKYAKWYIDNFELKFFEKDILTFLFIPLKVGNKSPML